MLKTFEKHLFAKPLAYILTVAGLNKQRFTQRRNNPFRQSRAIDCWAPYVRMQPSIRAYGGEHTRVRWAAINKIKQ